LARRLSTYFSLGSLNKELLKGNSKIYNGLLKYGHKNFTLDIIEYCESNVLIEREQYYINLLSPEYNILKIAGSRLGFKHSEATKDKMRGINNHFFGKTHSNETRQIIGLTLKSIIRTNNKPKAINLETKLKLSLRSHGVPVRVFDKSNNLIQQFPTMTSAAKYYGIHRRTIRDYLDKDRFYNEYAFKSNFKDNRI
jgi:group I intron endonuclease